MSSNDKKKEGNNQKLPHTVGRKASRRIKARRTRDEGVWFGLGMFGMVGWTIAVTTVIGITLGIWIDRNWPGPYSWTLTLLFIGLIIGCINAWYWVSKESRLDEEYDSDQKSD